MEYISGGDLFFHIRRSKTFSLEKAKFYAAELLLAIDFMHRNGVIYRDLKPENVLINHEGHIKIIDFGLSSFKSSTAMSKSSLDASVSSSIFTNNIVHHHDFAETQAINPSSRRNNASPMKNNFQTTSRLEAATICGTPEYIAPEVILGRRYTQTVDFYGLGLLLFEMLSGYNPYKVQDFGGNTNLMFEMIVNEQIQFNFPKRNFTNEAKDIIKQLMAKDPRKRLGHGKNGIEDIKNHPFFNGVDWEMMQMQLVEVPFKPSLNSVSDTRYVDKEFLRQSKKDKKDF